MLACQAKITCYRPDGSVLREAVTHPNMDVWTMAASDLDTIIGSFCDYSPLARIEINLCLPQQETLQGDLWKEIL